MRDHQDAEDPKQPRPIHSAKKGSNWFEHAETAPWRPTRKDIDRDRHRHVV